MAGDRGFEPLQTDPESVVLPLDESPVRRKARSALFITIQRGSEIWQDDREKGPGSPSQRCPFFGHRQRSGAKQPSPWQYCPGAPQNTYPASPPRCRMGRVHQAPYSRLRTKFSCLVISQPPAQAVFLVDVLCAMGKLRKHHFFLRTPSCSHGDQELVGLFFED
jgi:hypothetical protein